MRLKKRGARFAWSDAARAHAPVATTRVTLGWALSRAFSIGNSDMRIFLKYTPSTAARLRELAKIAGAFVVSPLLFVLLAFDAERRADALRRLWRAAGKAAALFGRHHEEYSVIHGD